MKLSNRLLVLLTFTVALGVAIRVFAHDAWVEPGAGPVYRVLYGHKAPEPYQPLKVTSVKALDARQQLLKFSRSQTAQGLSITTQGGHPSLFAVEFDNGYWVTVGKDLRNVRYSQLPPGTKGTNPSHPLKFSKTILQWQPWMTKPLGQRIEFVLAHYVVSPKAGSLLQLQLLLDGKPLAGQMVENNSDEQGPKTDANGQVSVQVVKGINRFATDHDITQPNDIDARRLSLTAALVFVAQ